MCDLDEICEVTIECDDCLLAEVCDVHEDFWTRRDLFVTSTSLVTYTNISELDEFYDGHKYA